MTCLKIAAVRWEPGRRNTLEKIEWEVYAHLRCFGELQYSVINFFFIGDDIIYEDASLNGG